MGKAKFSKLEIVLSALFCAVVVVACVLIGVLATKRSEASSEFSPSCPSVEAAERIDCIPDQVATKNLCNLRGCCWSPQIGTSTPWCFFSSNHGYRVDGELRTTQQGFQATLKRFSSPSLFGDDINTVLLTAEYQTQNRFHFKLTDPAANRFEVPHEHIGPFSGSAASNLKYSVNVQQNPFGIRVTRVSTGKVL